MIAIAQALGLGLAFGWLLHKGGLTRHATITAVFQLRDLTVLRFLLAALVAGGLAVQALVALDVSAGVPVPATRLLANAIGGLLFGVGMAGAGVCPGTIVAQAGEGHLDAWLAGLTGLIAGALAFGVLQPIVMPAIAPIGALGRVTAASLLGASPVLAAVVFTEVVVILLISLRRH